MQYGAVIELGSHRLTCGDCTNPEDISRLMQDFHAKLLFTSPPYSDLYEYSGNNLSPAHLAQFIPNMKPYADIMCVNLGLKKHDHEIITYWDEYISAARGAGLKLLSWNVWDKINPGSIAQQHYMFPLRHEFIFVFGEKTIVLNDTIPKKCPTPNRTHRPVRQKDGSVMYTTAQYSLRTHKPLETVITQGAVKARPVWGTAQMPVELAEEYIKAVTQEGDCVIDPFGGSGTTLIACEKLNRKCLIMEINPDMCSVISQRYEKEKLLWR
ncbi:MAG: site-specific DNA-methyltransferase [Synergistaceae bacterium]|nr:site-specific DNA-methyltransferase [Synergistaceae bacterium]MBQ6114678.1 site-specific DNA-methyltransferase [Synergistaceae bacterium]